MRPMSSSRRIILLALGALALVIPGLPGQNPANPKGIDVSSYQGTNNWTNIKNAGISFAFIKASEGLTIQDPDFNANWAGAKAAGIVRGAYHFARPTTSPSAAASGVAQANYFINIVKPSKGDIQLACDFEVTGGLSATNLAAWLTAFCGQIQTLTHTPAIVYTYPSFWSNMPSGWTNPNCGLWIANYGVTSPSIPAPWSGSGYAFWQYSDSGSVNGIGTNPPTVDLDTFNGSMTSLLKFTYPRDPMAGRR
jgi:GH25 family lysozyme M1 (1,4-beta-N-acetylmuramidase)